ncbi:MAG TPA: hypothetical protein VGN12_25355 [Pirellulales bacterium]
MGIAFVPQSVPAQLLVQPGLVLGYYTPSGSQHSVDGPNIPANFGGPMVGAEISLWTRHRIGFRASGSRIVIDHTAIPNPGGFTPLQGGEVVLGALLAAFDLSPQRNRAVWFGVGPGFIHHGGDAFASSGSPTETVGVFALGTQIPLGHAWSLGLSATEHIYEYHGIFGDVGGPPHFDSSGPLPHFERRAQHDFVVSATIAWRSH